MAVSMSAALSLPSKVVSGRRFACTATLLNSGSTDTTFLNAQPYLLSSDGRTPANGAVIGPIATPDTIAGYTGSAPTISGTNGTLVIWFDLVIPEPAQWGQTAQAVAGYTLGLTCATSDGSVFNAPPLHLTITRQAGMQDNGLLTTFTVIGNSHLPAYKNIRAPGCLLFNHPYNTVNFFAFR